MVASEARKFIAAAFARIALAALAISAIAPFAEARSLALVIGNNDYQHVPTLRTAVNDSVAVADRLEKLGFVVRRATNLDRAGMSRALAGFEASLQPGDRALFFYSGHGFEISGANYLLPIDVPAAGVDRLNLVRDTAFPVESVIDDIRARGARVTILVLDACRDNPFLTPGSRTAAAHGGLARVDAPEGVFVLMSAGAKQEALDSLTPGEPEKNSVFTRTFLHELDKPGRTLVQIAKATQVGVKNLAATIGYEQTPAYYDQIVGDVVLSDEEVGAPQVGAPMVQEPAQAPAVPAQMVAGLAPDRKIGAALKVGGPAPIANFMRSNAGWTATLSLPEPAIALSYRIGDIGEFKSTGLTDVIDERTGQRRPNPSFPLSFKATATVVQVRYQTPDGASVGPFPIWFDPEQALFREQKQILESMPGNWVEFREFQGEMIYFTTLVTYRCAISELHFGLNAAKPLQRYDLPACNAADPFSVPEKAPLYIKVPVKTQSINLQITWRDGTLSEVSTVERR